MIIRALTNLAAAVATLFLDVCFDVAVCADRRARRRLL